MSRFISSANRNFRASAGQTMTEYAVVLAVLTSAAAFIFPALGGQVVALVNQVARYLP